MPKALRKVKGLHTIESKPAIDQGDRRYNVRMMTWHKSINQVSGSMVLSFKRGPSTADRAEWSRALHRLADEIMIDELTA